MRALKFVERLAFEGPVARLVAALLVIGLLRVGIWLFPNLQASLLIAQDPFRNPLQDPVSHYLMWNWLGPYLAWLVGATEIGTHALLFLAFSLAFVALFIGAARLSLSDEQSRKAIIAFFMLPVSGTSFYWVGMDSLTLLLLMIASCLRHVPAAAPVVGILLGMQHFEQGLFAVLALVVSAIVAAWTTRRPPDGLVYWLLCLAGLVAGKALLRLVFDAHGVHVSTDRADWLAAHLKGIVAGASTSPHAIVWSVLGIGWVLALRYADRGRASLPFFVPLALLVGLMFFVGDQTRVLCIVTFPLVYVHWLSDEAFLSSISRAQASLLLIVGSLMPWYWFWGEPQGSAFPFDVLVVLDGLLDLRIVPEQFWTWPFRL